jgi:hypothetical protein
LGWSNTRGSRPHGFGVMGQPYEVHCPQGGVSGVSPMVKPPHHGYRLWRDMHGCLHHQGEALALKRHHRLFTHLLSYDYPDLTLSGEAGVAVLRTARAAVDQPFRCPRR